MSATSTQPVMSEYSAPYWAGVEAGELRLPWCTACGDPHFPPRPFCPWCLSDDIEWRPASGNGTLYSFTTVRANPPSAFVHMLPFVIAIVRLDEGVQMMTHIHGDDANLVCDAPVTVTFAEINGVKLPAFTVTETPA